MELDSKGIDFNYTKTHELDAKNLKKRDSCEERFNRSDSKEIQETVEYTSKDHLSKSEELEEYSDFEDIREEIENHSGLSETLEYESDEEEEEIQFQQNSKKFQNVFLSSKLSETKNSFKSRTRENDRKSNVKINFKKREIHQFRDSIDQSEDQNVLDTESRPDLDETDFLLKNKLVMSKFDRFFQKMEKEKQSGVDSSID